MDRNCPQSKRHRCIFARFPILKWPYRGATLCVGTDYVCRLDFARCCFFATCRGVYRPETTARSVPRPPAKPRCPPPSMARPNSHRRPGQGSTDRGRVGSATSTAVSSMTIPPQGNRAGSMGNCATLIAPRTCEKPSYRPPRLARRMQPHSPGTESSTARYYRL